MQKHMGEDIKFEEMFSSWLLLYRIFNIVVWLELITFWKEGFQSLRGIVVCVLL